jgi:hypothetical protein
MYLVAHIYIKTGIFISKYWGEGGSVLNPDSILQIVLDPDPLSDLPLFM